jgi:hypothetical protein
MVLVRRHAGFIVLALVVGASAWAKMHLLWAGPETDPDAIAHAMAGRLMLDDWTNLSIHWVWLPWWHAVHALGAALGGGLFYVRLLNVILSSLSPFLLASLLCRLRDPCAGGRVARAWPWLAGAILAIDPLTLTLAATGQSEIAVQTLVLAACVCWQRGLGRWSVASGVLLAAAAMTRYEAWPLAALVALSWWRRPAPTRWQRWLGAAAWLVPLVAIASWCWLQFRHSGEPLHFLRYNRGFASDYFARAGYPWGSASNPALAGTWYLAVVPLATFGPFALAIPFGVGPLVRRAPRVFVLAELTMLGFLSAGFVAEQHLGLARHAVVFAPLYAALLAAGMLRLGQLSGERVFSRVERRLATGVTLSAAFAATVVAPAYAHTWSHHRRSYQPQARAAAVLSVAARQGDRIYCDLGTVEVMSNLPPAMFTRWQLPDVSLFHLRRVAARGASAWVVSTRERVGHLADAATVWFRDGDLVVMHYGHGEPAAPPRPLQRTESTNRAGDERRKRTPTQVR